MVDCNTHPYVFWCHMWNSLTVHVESEVYLAWRTGIWYPVLGLASKVYLSEGKERLTLSTLDFNTSHATNLLIVLEPACTSSASFCARSHLPSRPRPCASDAACVLQLQRDLAKCATELLKPPHAVPNTTVRSPF